MAIFQSSEQRAAGLIHCARSLAAIAAGSERRRLIEIISTIWLIFRYFAALFFSSRPLERQWFVSIEARSSLPIWIWVWVWVSAGRPAGHQLTVARAALGREQINHSRAS